MIWLVEVFLLFLLGIAVAEVKFHSIEHLIDSLLKKEKIHFTIDIEDFNKITIKDLTIEQKPLLKEVTIIYEIFPLLHKRLVLDSLFIQTLDLNNLLALSNKNNKSAQTEWSILIKKFQGTLHYFYQQKNQAFITAQMLTPTNIQQLSINANTFLGEIKASGRMKQKKLFLQGLFFPKLPSIKASKTPFDLTITKKEILFSFKPSHLTYQKFKATHTLIKGSYNHKILQASIQSQVDANLSKASLDATLTYDQKLHYQLKALLQTKKLPIPISYQAYKEFELQAKGDLEHINFQATNPLVTLTGSYMFKPKLFTLHTASIPINKLYPTPLDDLRAKLSIQGTLSHFQGVINSNYFQSHFTYQKELNATVRFIKDYQGIHLRALPLRIHYDTKLSIHSPLFQAEFDKSLNGSITIPSTKITIKHQKQFQIQAKIDSVQKLFKHLQKLYPFTPPPIDTHLTLNLNFNPQNRHFNAFLEANQGFQPFHIAFFQTKFHGTFSHITIDYYALLFKGHGIYATKPSHIFIDKDTITIQPFWIEDNIKVTGRYHQKSSDGLFHIKGKNYNYSSIEGSLSGDLDLKAILNQQKLSIEGTILLHNGDITYLPSKSYEISDPDIIVVDKKSKHSSSFFKENIACNIKIDTKGALLYTIPDLKILLKPDALLYKEYQKDIELLGLVHILQGTYRLPNTKIVIEPSTLSFYGPLDNPLLDLYAKTKKDNYSIYITISGSIQHPYLNFQSDPYLPPNQILSLLTIGNGSNLVQNAINKEFATFLSNFFIKDLIQKFGLRLDTLTLSTSSKGIGFVVGTHITDRLSVLYKNGEISTIIIRYNINNHLEADAQFNPQSSGVHLYYRKVR